LKNEGSIRFTRSADYQTLPKKRARRGSFFLPGTSKAKFQRSIGFADSELPLRRFS
jgi:hypothetical protein